MFENLQHAETAFRGALSQLSVTENPVDRHMRGVIERAFDYALAEAIRRGRARVVWHQDPPQQETK